MAIAVEEGLAGKTILWGAPVYDQCRVGWDETLRALGGVGRPNETRMDIALPNAGRILFRSLNDPDNARSHTADGVVIDEAARCNPAAWFDVLRHMLIDTGGWAWLIGSPNGHNWYWREHVRAQRDPSSRAWRAPTLGYRVVGGVLTRTPHPLENPHIPESEIEQLFGGVLLSTFRQEILAEFTESAGQVFRVTDEDFYPGAAFAEHAQHRIVAGLDWGQVKDYSVLSLGCATCSKELLLDRFNTDEYPAQRDRIRGELGRFTRTEKREGRDNLTVAPELLAESNAMGLPNIEQLRTDGVAVTSFATTHASKAQLVQAMRLAFEQRAWRWLENDTARDELEAYAQSITREGNVTYSAPEGMHDDTVVGRMLMLHQAQVGNVGYA